MIKKMVKNYFYHVFILIVSFLFISNATAQLNFNGFEKNFLGKIKILDLFKFESADQIDSSTDFIALVEIIKPDRSVEQKLVYFTAVQSSDSKSNSSRKMFDLPIDLSKIRLDLEGIGFSANRKYSFRDRFFVDHESVFFTYTGSSSEIKLWKGGANPRTFKRSGHEDFAQARTVLTNLVTGAFGHPLKLTLAERQSFLTGPLGDRLKAMASDGTNLAFSAMTHSQSDLPSYLFPKGSPIFMVLREPKPGEKHPLDQELNKLAASYHGDLNSLRMAASWIFFTFDQDGKLQEFVPSAVRTVAHSVTIVYEVDVGIEFGLQINNSELFSKRVHKKFMEEATVNDRKSNSGIIVPFFIDSEMQKMHNLSPYTVSPNVSSLQWDFVASLSSLLATIASANRTNLNRTGTSNANPPPSSFLHYISTEKRILNCNRLFN